MIYYKINFDGKFGQHVEEIWSEKQVLDSYFPYWCEQMVKSGHGDEVNEKRCIDDWCVVNWAIEVPKPGWID